MEAKVPQRIDMEDRLVGPLTFQQFLYLLFGGLIIYLVNNWTMSSPFRPLILYPITAFVGPLALCLAFLKVQERPFIYFLASLVRYVSRPRLRIWKRGEHLKLVRIVDKVENTAPAVTRRPIDRQRLQGALRRVEGPPAPPAAGNGVANG